jgi:hypothetical protein
MTSRRESAKVLGTEDALKALPRRGRRERDHEEISRDTPCDSVTHMSKRVPKKKTEVSQEALLEGLEADLAALEGDVEGILGRNVNFEEDDEVLQDDDTNEEVARTTSKKARARKKERVKKPTQKQLRKVASETSAMLRNLGNKDGEQLKKGVSGSDLNTFYRKTPVGKALYATIEMMRGEGLLVEGGDTEILARFDEAAQDILASSDQTLCLPPSQTFGRTKVRSRKLTVEGDLVSYNNWCDNWVLEAENVVYRLGDEVLRAEKGQRASMFVKAADSKPSSGLGRKRKM